MNSLNPGQSRDLVKRRIANLKDAHFGCPVQYFAQRFHHFWKDVASVTVRIPLFVPQADQYRLTAARDHKSQLVLKAFLLAQQRNRGFLDQTRKLCQTLVLQADGDTASKHVNLLGWVG